MRAHGSIALAMNRNRSIEKNLVLTVKTFIEEHFVPFTVVYIVYMPENDVCAILESQLF